MAFSTPSCVGCSRAAGSTPRRALDPSRPAGGVLVKKRDLAAAAAMVVVAGSASAAEPPVLFAETCMGSNPTSLATDSSGSVFVVRSRPDAITTITSAGASTASWGTPQAGGIGPASSWLRAAPRTRPAIRARIRPSGSSRRIARLPRPTRLPATDHVRSQQPCSHAEGHAHRKAHAEEAVHRGGHHDHVAQTRHRLASTAGSPAVGLPAFRSLAQ